jgi:hypothetical protein
LSRDEGEIQSHRRRDGGDRDEPKVAFQRHHCGPAQRFLDSTESPVGLFRADGGDENGPDRKVGPDAELKAFRKAYWAGAAGVAGRAGAPGEAGVPGVVEAPELGIEPDPVAPELWVVEVLPVVLTSPVLLPS